MNKVRWVDTNERLPEEQMIEDECNTYYVIELGSFGFSKGFYTIEGWYHDYTTKICVPVTAWLETLK